MGFLLNSIKGRIFGWYFIATSILIFILGTGIYLEVSKALDSSQDELLHSKMQILLGIFNDEENESPEKHNKAKDIEQEMSGTVYGEYSIPHSGHYYKIILKNKNIIFSPSLDSNNFNFIPDVKNSYDEMNQEYLYNSIGPAGERVRVINKKLILFGSPVEIFMAENTETNRKILDNLMIFLLVSIPLSIIFIGLLALIIAKNSLKPLERFSEEVNQVSHKNLNKRMDVKNQMVELGQLSNSFNKMMDRLDKVFNMEKILISEASHQLKTPVAVIKSHCDIILQKRRTESEYIESLSTIKEVTENMVKMIKNLLSLAQLDTNNQNNPLLNKISLNKSLEQAIILCKKLADKKNIEIKLEKTDEIFISGDKDRICEAFLNIIENAIKYNKENGFVLVKLEKKDNYAFISIEDSGVGIKEDDIEHIFDRFYRSYENSDIEGTGLGLSIAKSIIEQHNGQIWLESKIGEGTTCYCKFII